jgi:bifunctional non-homologous end joining protein LigD
MIQNIELFYREGSSDKVYKANITETDKGFEVNFAYGRRGNSLTTGKKTTKPVPLDQAQKIYNKLIQEKTAKGYIEDPQGKPFTGTITESRDTGRRPQLLNEIDEKLLEKYLSDPEWCAQEKFDGRRRLLMMDGTGFSIAANRKGLSIPIEIDTDIELRHLLQGNETSIIDGEDMGDHVVAFDCLTTFTEDYKSRYTKLAGMFSHYKGSKIKLAYTAWTVTEKRALYKRLVKENAEGIVFKNINAFYVPGRPNSGGDQLKFKFVATATVQVIKTNPAKRSVMLAVYDLRGNKIEVGNVTVYPNQQIPTPGTIVEVRYLYYFAGGSLFQPVLLGERDDMTIEDCTLSQLKEKRETVEV